MVLNVLVVDDEKALRDLCADILRCVGGNEVVVASGVEEAKLVFASKQFDLVLSDIDMPDGKGTDFCRHVRAADPAIRVILMSGNLPHHEAELANVRPDATLQKPFNIMDLVSIVESVATKVAA